MALLPGLLPGSARLALALAVHAVVLAVSASVLYTGQPILRASQFQTLTTLGVKQTWGYASLVYAFGGIAAVAALGLARLALGVDAARDDPAASSLS